MNDKQAQSIIVVLGLAALAWWAFQDPLLTDADDCTAQGRDEECWRER